MTPFPEMEAGWIPGIAHVVSPNQDERPAGETVSLVKGEKAAGHIS